MPSEVNDEWDERRSLIRQVRHRLESLGRAGLASIPVSRRAAEPAAAPCGSFRSARLASGDEADDLRSPSGGGRASPPPVAASLFEESGFDPPVVPAADRPAILAACALEVSKCTRCPHLASTRTQTVFGTGTPTARLIFIGEAPGADEDRIGQPFVGRAGQLLTDMITKGMGLRREDVYIANVLKCRPPDNRPPTPEEAANCSSYLDHQIAVIRPEFLCLLGKSAAAALLGVPLTTTMAPLRKRWHRYKGIRALVTYHPSYLLRTESAKKEAWVDLQLLMKEMGLPVPGRRASE